MSMLTRRTGPSLFGSLSPMSDIERLPEFVRRIFADGTGFGTATPSHPGWVPAVDVVENEDALVLTAELPGMSEKDITLSLENGVLTLTGEKKEEKRDDAKGYYLLERSYGALQRTFALPKSVDAAAIDARFAHGVLTITLPKVPQAKGRTIAIKATA
jgi:HSP20 family molecular chaperone IbpA